MVLGFLLQLLIVEEQADQAGGNRGLGQLDEAGGLHFQRLVTPEVGSFLDGLDGFDRGRIIRAGLAGNEALGSFEAHHLFDGVELELFQLGLTLGLVVQLAGDGPLDQIQRCGLQLVGSHYSIDGTHFQGVVRTVFLARGNPLDRIIGTDNPRQAHGAAEARVDTQFDFRQADLGAVGHDAVIRGQAHFKTTAQGDAIDRGHGWNIEVFKITEDLVGFEVASHQLRIRQLEAVDELGDVGADDKYVFATGDNHALDRTIGLDRINRLTQFVEGMTVEFVDGLTLEVEFQFDDAALKSLNRDGFTFVNHQLISTVWKLNSTHRSQPASYPTAQPFQSSPYEPGTPADAIIGPD
ncbi:hypothetical protein D3C84_418420 [compost metagenome]